MVQRLLQKIQVVAIKVPTNFDIVGLRELLTNYRVHHYKLRKMHLIVCSHNPQKKHEHQEVKIPYTEILTNTKENKLTKEIQKSTTRGFTTIEVYQAVHKKLPKRLHKREPEKNKCKT